MAVKNSNFSLFLIGLSLAAAQPTMAEVPNFKDARKFAMGGVGVASSSPTGASFSNPALSAIKQLDEKNGFGLLLPGIALELADEDEMIDKLDAIGEQTDKYNEAVEIGDLYNAKSSSREIGKNLRAIDNDTLKANLGLGVAVQVPNPTLSVGFFASSAVSLLVNTQVDGDDFDFLDGIQTANSTEELQEIGDEGYELESEARLLGLNLTEAGVSFASNVDVAGHTIAVGISPKFVQIKAIDYTTGTDNFEEDDADSRENTTDKSEFNVDLGAACQFGEDKNWTTGVMLRNVLPMELKTITGALIEVNPQLTIGVAHRSEWHTLAVDLDVMKQENSGMEKDSQYVAVGGEFDLFDTLQLRAGVRQNLLVSDPAQLTAGLGFSPFGMRLDLSALSADNQIGVALESGFQF